MTAATPEEPRLALAARSVTKRFRGVVANDRVDFEVAVGEVHALLGENGAGKTTLCNVLTGLYRPEEGYMEVGGRPVRMRSPHDAQEAGIFMVHQQFRLVQSLSVAENVVLGWSRQGGMWFVPRRVEREVAALAEQYGMDVKPQAKIWQLSVGEQQKVEILKALYRGARILIMDEPTSVLTPQEVEQLVATLRAMTRSGSAVVFISHKLPEVLAVSDRVTVLRAGRTVGTVETASTGAAALAHMMVGRDVAFEGSPRSRHVDRSVVLSLEGLCADGDFGTPALVDVGLEVHAGEVLGIAGVAGNGQRELAEVIAGERARTGGTVVIAGRAQAGRASEAIAAGLGYVPEDRKGVGVAPGLSIADNLRLKSYRRDGLIMHNQKAAADAEDVIRRFGIVARGPKTLARELSGGNLQKLIVARELSSGAKVLVVSSPTRGLDVGATESVRQLLLGSARDGVGVVLISEDLDEIFELADRIAVLYRGRVTGLVNREDADLDRIGLMMAGEAVA
jgi:ABC-type uncharacterized transport system ATPase subunit